VLTVRDNGIGFVHGPKPGSGMGLEIMRYRAAMIGGKVAMLTKPGRGVTVICRFPNPPAVARKLQRKR
jgi:two-component system CheB/CheR fusion protein